MATNNNCWSCGYQQNDGHKTFLGICTFFSSKGKPNKEIPTNVVDVGCNRFAAKTDNKKTPKDEASSSVATDTNATMKQLSPTLEYEYQERVAIMEYDGRQSREKAEACATALLPKRT